MSEEPRMTGMDKEIFNATRTLTSLLNDACNHWNYLCPYLEKLAGVADDTLRGYQKDYPEQVAELIDYRRERDSHGNAAALREALEEISSVSTVNIKEPIDGDSSNLYQDARYEGDKFVGVALPAWVAVDWYRKLKEVKEKAEAALSAPVRNCEQLAAPTDSNGNTIHVADKVHMLNTDSRGDHEWDDEVCSLEFVGKGGGDEWLVHGCEGTAWACECEVLAPAAERKGECDA